VVSASLPKIGHSNLNVSAIMKGSDMSDIYTIEDVKLIESEISLNLGNTGAMLTLGVSAKFYAIVGDKDGAAWVARNLAGTGFSFTARKRTDGELSSRDAMIVALVNDGASFATIANTIGVSAGTAHSVATREGVKPAGGNRVGGGRKPAAKVAPAAPAAPAKVDAKVDPTAKPATPEAKPAAPAKGKDEFPGITQAIAGIDRVKSKDREADLDAYAIILGHLLTTADVDAVTLATRLETMLATK